VVPLGRRRTVALAARAHCWPSARRRPRQPNSAHRRRDRYRAYSRRPPASPYARWRKQVSAELPAPWRAAVATAAQSRLDDCRNTLERVITRTDIGEKGPPWWRFGGLAQTLFALIALAGLVCSTPAAATRARREDARAAPLGADRNRCYCCSAASGAGLLVSLLARAAGPGRCPGRRVRGPTPAARRLADVAQDQGGGAGTGGAEPVRTGACRAGLDQGYSAFR